MQDVDVEDDTGYGDAVYADLSVLRYVVPAGLLLAVAVIGAVVALQVLSPEPSLGSQSAVEEEPTAEADASLDPQAAAEATVARFIEALQTGRFTGWTFAFNQAPEVEAELAAIGDGLGDHALSAVAGPVTLVDAANATTPLTMTWTLADGVVFTTIGELDLVLVGTEWLVDWEPSILEASLNPGDTLVRERVVAPRAPILARDGTPIVDNRPTFNIGVIPRQSDDIAGLTATLGQLLGEDVAEMRERIAPSPSESVVILAVRSPDQIADIEGQLRALSGVVLQPSTFPSTPSERFGRALLGRSAEVTAEILEESPGLFVPGEVAGRSGLQRIYNERLAGTPGFQIRVDRRFAPGVLTAPTTSAAPAPVDDPGAESTSTAAAGSEPAESAQPTAVVEGADPDVVYLSAPVPGEPLQTTLDPRVQTAAEDALARTELPSALVAIQVSTGQVLAVANAPGAAVDNFAMTGQYPPGSIFKVVTAYAALGRGLGPETPVDCPELLNVDGREFRNAEGEVLGTVPLWVAFAQSCNTAFINVASSLDNGDFAAAARRLGIGASYALGTDAFSGLVPNPDGPVEKAATAFGQSRVLVSPLGAAVMAATVAGGTYRPPSLVDPPDPPAAAEPLDPAAAETLRQMMRAVVTNGTGRAVAGARGGPVAGKTGTAEFGDEVPPRAHAWFVGFQGDMAFAVFVEGGEFGGATAAPIAGAFLDRLAG